VDTVQKAHAAGLSACSGLIAGMGESDEDLVDVVYALRELDPDSVPVNFLIPFEGTPLAKEWNLTPQRCLRILAMVRFVCPDVEVRIAGGREVHLRALQPLALHLANSIFLGDYLTSEGQAGKADLEMIADAGFEVENAGEVTLPEHRVPSGGGCGSHAQDGCGSHDGAGCGSHAEAGCGSHEGGGVCGSVSAAPAEVPAAVAEAPADARTDLVSVRRRGAGTDLAPNA
jgi:biotin synthase